MQQMCQVSRCTRMAVHCLISSVQRLRGLPRRLSPATMPCRTCLQRLSARTTWLKYYSFLLLTSARKRRAGSNSSNIELSVLCSVQLILIILLYMSISTALRSAALIDKENTKVKSSEFCPSPVKVRSAERAIYVWEDREQPRHRTTSL